ncbi:choice-of-anchor E domain-containing protein [Janthinobacterium sp.]|uniref:PEP-CTERM sorting domain-containing protein n=1 Tax=Janthinobacterium sp. TaxID=1871054 RepID=UPI00293D9D30|nr:choice-of-anchor E domain-containing protein [Janthinobacterium sp.]
MKLNTLARVLLLAGCAAAASASATTQTVSSASNVIVSHDTDWADFLNFQKFNTALGTLTSVKFDLYADVAGSVTLTNYSGDVAAIPVSLGVDVWLRRPDATTLAMLSVPLLNQSVNLADGDSTTLSNHLHASTSSVFSNASDLALFSGAGSVATLISANANSDVGGDGIDAQFATMAGGHGTVTYSYIAAVPEPETYAMLLLGIGVIGFTAKRRQARDARA